MVEILRLLPVLAVAILMNLLGGLYYNIGTKKCCFSWNKLLLGIAKATIVAVMFIGTAYCFEVVDLSSIGIEPIFIIMSAITLYIAKALVTLGKIFGIEVKTNK